MPTEVESPMCATERHEVRSRCPDVLLASFAPAAWWPARAAPAPPLAADPPGRPLPAAPPGWPVRDPVPVACPPAGPARCPGPVNWPAARGSAGRGPGCDPGLAADTI